MARCFSAKKSKAGKEIKCGQCGAVIQPGETYYYFAVGFRGVKQIRCAKHHPRQSELCGSKLSGVYAAIEGVEDTLNEKTVTVEGIADALESAASDVENVQSEYQDSLDNMPENFQQGQTGEEIQEKIDACEQFASALNDAASDVRDIEGEGEDTPLDKARERAEEVLMEFGL